MSVERLCTRCGTSFRSDANAMQCPRCRDEPELPELAPVDDVMPVLSEVPTRDTLPVPELCEELRYSASDSILNRLSPHQRVVYSLLINALRNYKLPVIADVVIGGIAILALIVSALLGYLLMLAAYWLLELCGTVIGDVANDGLYLVPALWLLVYSVVRDMTVKPTVSLSRNDNGELTRIDLGRIESGLGRMNPVLVALGFGLGFSLQVGMLFFTNTHCGLAIEGGFGECVLLTLDNVCHGVFLDTFELYNLNFGDKPTHGFWSACIFYVFRLYFDVLALFLVLYVVQRWRLRRHFDTLPDYEDSEWLISWLEASGSDKNSWTRNAFDESIFLLLCTLYLKGEFESVREVSKQFPRLLVEQDVRDLFVGTDDEKLFVPKPIDEKKDEAPPKDEPLIDKESAVETLNSAGAEIEMSGGRATVVKLVEKKITERLLTAIRFCTDLEELSFFQSDLTDRGLRSLKNLSRLRKLVIDYTRVSGEGLDELAGLTELRTLSFTTHHMTSTAFRRITVLKGLEELDISNTYSVGDDEMKYVATLASLRSLDVKQTRVGNAGLSPLKYLRNLRRLVLSGTEVNDDGMKMLAAFPVLESLVLPSAVTDVGLKEVARLTQLRELVWEWPASLTNEGILALGGMTELRKLSLKGSAATVDGFKALGGLRNLEELELNSMYLEDGPWTWLRNLTRLRVLVLEDACAGDLAMPALSALVKLEELNLKGNRITDEGAAHLRGLPLTKLNLGGTMVGNESLRTLSGSMRHLDLEGTGTTDVGLEELRRMSALESLNLNDTEITDLGAIPLSRATTLKTLKLNNTRLTDAGLIHLARLKNLEELELMGTRASRKAVQKLQGELPECTITF